jgi:hypothetical protein
VFAISFQFHFSNRLRIFSEVDDAYTHSCGASLGRHPIERAYRQAGAIVISGGMVRCVVLFCFFFVMFFSGVRRWTRPGDERVRKRKLSFFSNVFDVSF